MTDEQRWAVKAARIIMSQYLDDLQQTRMRPAMADVVREQLEEFNTAFPVER